MDEQMLRVMMSSEKKDWATPPELFGPINEIFGFDLDVCATADNSKCELFISPEMDAFKTEWGRVWDSGCVDPLVCWNNPPYGKPESACKIPWEKCEKKVCRERGFHLAERLPGIGDWVQRSYEQSEKHGSDVVCLLPARTDTHWFQVVWDHARLIAFLRGRFKFVGASQGATFPSAIVVFSRSDLDDDVYEDMTELGNVIDPRDGQIMIYNGERK